MTAMTKAQRFHKTKMALEVAKKADENFELSLRVAAQSEAPQSIRTLVEIRDGYKIDHENGLMISDESTSPNIRRQAANDIIKHATPPKGTFEDELAKIGGEAIRGIRSIKVTHFTVEMNADQKAKSDAMKDRFSSAKDITDKAERL